MASPKYLGCQRAHVVYEVYIYIRALIKIQVFTLSITCASLRINFWFQTNPITEKGREVQNFENRMPKNVPENSAAKKKKALRKKGRTSRSRSSKLLSLKIPYTAVATLFQQLYNF